MDGAAKLTVLINPSQSWANTDGVVAARPASRSMGCAFEPRPGQNNILLVTLVSTTSLLGARHSGIAWIGNNSMVLTQ